MEQWKINGTSGIPQNSREYQQNNGTTQQHQEKLPVQNINILSRDNITEFKTRMLFYSKKVFIENSQS